VDGVYVHAIPNLTDNYCYLVVGPDGSACLIDPGDGVRVLQAVRKIEKTFYPEGLSLSALINTHKHWDHQGGNVVICKQMTSVTRIYCGENADPRKLLTRVKDGDKITVGSLEFLVIGAAGHTRGGNMYLLGKKGLFTGDTLFSGGCGMHFEGNEIDMLRNFVSIQLKCSEDALLFPGHEYTEMLLKQTLSSGQWGSSSPGEFFSFTNALYRTLHRRECEERLPTVPVRLDEELIVNKNFHQIDFIRHYLNNRLRSGRCTEGSSKGDDDELISDVECPVKCDSGPRTFTTTKFDPSYIIIDRQEWLTLKERYSDEGFTRAENRPFQPVAEATSIFGSGPVNCVEDALSVLGVESGGHVLSKERLLCSLDADVAAIVANYFDTTPHLSAAQLTKHLGFTRKTCWSRWKESISNIRCFSKDEEGEEEEEDESSKEVIQSREAHPLESCAYCALQLDIEKSTVAPSTESRSFQLAPLPSQECLLDAD